jgi:hypothetical protein
MIHSTVAHVVAELNDYLRLRTRSDSANLVISGSYFDPDGTPNSEAENKVLATLVGVGEDSVYRSVDVFERSEDGTSLLVDPEVSINCYVLFGANLKDYDEALKQLSYVIAFFQRRTAFPLADIGEGHGNGRVSAELHSLTFEQQNHLWGALGGKYVPSVLYKLGIIAIRDEEPAAQIMPVREILVTD